jgi:hypothetical protein
LKTRFNGLKSARGILRRERSCSRTTNSRRIPAPGTNLVWACWRTPRAPLRYSVSPLAMLGLHLLHAHEPRARSTPLGQTSLLQSDAFPPVFFATVSGKAPLTQPQPYRSHGHRGTEKAICLYGENRTLTLLLERNASLSFAQRMRCLRAVFQGAFWDVAHVRARHEVKLFEQIRCVTWPLICTYVGGIPSS